jgi:hypothetical protein
VSAEVEALARVVCPCTVSTPVAVRLVAEALARVVCPVALMVVVKKLTAVSPVVDACVRSEVEAKRLEVNVLRNRRVDDPREKVVSEDGVMFPAIWRRSVGEVTPIPIFPLEAIVKNEDPEEEATFTMLEVSPAVPLIENLEDGVVDPIPTLPLAKTVKSEVPVEDATLNGLRLEVLVACTLKI